MDFATTTNSIEFHIPSLLTKLYSLTIYALWLLFLLCYENPKSSLLLSMLSAYMILFTIFDSITRAFFTSPIHRLPLAIAFIFVALAWYLHRTIKEYDKTALKEAVIAARFAAVEQNKVSGGCEDTPNERHGSCDEEEGRLIGKTRTRARSGGLDMDVWQGGQRMKRRERTLSREMALGSVGS